MRGAIEKRQPGVWCVRVDLPRLAGGRRRQKRLTLRGTRRDAEAALAGLLHEVAGGTHTGPNILLSEVFATWLASRQPLVEEGTFVRYESLLRLYLTPELGALRVRQLTTARIETARHTWLTGARHDGERGTLSRRSVQHAMDALRAALRWAKRTGRIDVNPFEAVEPMTIADPEQAALDVASVSALLKCLHGSELLNPVLVLLGTGLRRGELLGLQWGDVDWDGKLVRVVRALKKVSGRLEYRSLKSRRSRRSLPLPVFVLMALQKQRAAQAELLSMLEAPQTLTTPIFDRLGALWDPGVFTLAFHRFVRRSGAPRVRLHDLRHSYTSLGLQAGTSLRVLSELLGHAGYAITADRYAHVLGGLYEEAATGLDRLLGAAIVANGNN